MSRRFPRVGRLHKGYHPRQVDDFLNHIEVSLSGVLPPPTAREIREAGFELVRGGYDTAAVDAALDALEEKVLTLAQRVSARHGRIDSAAEAQFLRAELAKPYLARFPRAGALRRGYDIDDVDTFIDRVLATLDGSGELTLRNVRTAVFRPRRGGYDEDAVDETLDRLVELVMLREHAAQHRDRSP